MLEWSPEWQTKGKISAETEPKKSFLDRTRETPDENPLLSRKYRTEIDLFSNTLPVRDNQIIFATFTRLYRPSPKCLDIDVILGLICTNPVNTEQCFEAKPSIEATLRYLRPLLCYGGLRALGGINTPPFAPIPFYLSIGILSYCPRTKK